MSPGPVRSWAFETGRVSCLAWRDRRGLAGTWAPDQFAVADRVVADGELEGPHEDETAVSRGATVEPEHEFVQVAGQVLTVHCSLMGAQQPPLGQRGDAMHTGKQLRGIPAARRRRTLTAPIVDIAGRLDTEVATPPVGNHRGADLDVIGDELVQCRGARILDDRHPAPTETSRGCVTSTATQTSAFLPRARPPASPGS